MSRGRCMVLLPEGCHRLPSGRLLDYDALYRDCIQPAVSECSLQLVRPHLHVSASVLNSARFRELTEHPYCIADLSLPNPVVAYQVGVRHAVRSGGTVLMFADVVQLLFTDMDNVALVYSLSENGSIIHPAALKERLMQRLDTSAEGHPDSPAFPALAGGVCACEPAGEGACSRVPSEGETLREAVARVVASPGDSLSTLIALEARILAPQGEHLDAAHDLFLAYRGEQAWGEMVALFARLPHSLRTLPALREQFALALNRAGDPKRAEEVLRQLHHERGASGESYGVLGRLYKDQWEAARFANQDTLALGFMDKAIDAYLKGFNADLRDPYPGINAVTLMEIREPPDPRRERLLPIVKYAAETRVQAGTRDYWDYATLLEASVLSRDQAMAARVLQDAISASREAWQPKSTARNLRLIREARERRKERRLGWTLEIESSLETCSGE